MVLQSVKCKITVDIAIETIGNFIAEGMHVGDALPSLGQCCEEDIDFVNCGADVAAIGANCSAFMKKYENAVK